MANEHELFHFTSQCVQLYARVFPTRRERCMTRDETMMITMHLLHFLRFWVFKLKKEVRSVRQVRLGVGNQDQQREEHQVSPEYNLSNSSHLVVHVHPLLVHVTVLHVIQATTTSLRFFNIFFLTWVRLFGLSESYIDLLFAISSIKDSFTEYCSRDKHLLFCFTRWGWIWQH